MPKTRPSYSTDISVNYDDPDFVWLHIWDPLYKWNIHVIAGDPPRAREELRKLYGDELDVDSVVAEDADGTCIGTADEGTVIMYFRDRSPFISNVAHEVFHAVLYMVRRITGGQVSMQTRLAEEAAAYYQEWLMCIITSNIGSIRHG